MGSLWRLSHLVQPDRVLDVFVHVVLRVEQVFSDTDVRGESTEGNNRATELFSSE